MEMINRLTADALDSKSFVNRIKAMEDERRMEMEKALTEKNDVTGTVYGGTENRQQRRARERAERKAAIKAKP